MTDLLLKFFGIRSKCFSFLNFRSHLSTFIRVARNTIAITQNSTFYLGIGYAGVLVMQYVNIYYTVILGWALFYMFASFQSRLPWSHCGNEWNTPNCVDHSEKSTHSGMDTNNSIVNATMLVNTTLRNAPKVSASQEYWE